LREISHGKRHMNSDNPISSCHLLEWYRWAECAWEEVWEQVWDVCGEEKGEGVAGAEGKAGSVGSWGADGSGSIVTIIEGNRVADV
jgi:hypothetical protein